MAEPAYADDSFPKYREKAEVEGIPNQVTSARQLKIGRKLQLYSLDSGTPMPFASQLVILSRPQKHQTTGSFYVKVGKEGNGKDPDTLAFLADIGIKGYSKGKWNRHVAAGFAD